MLRAPVQRVLVVLWRARKAVAGFLDGVPFWPDIVRFAARVVAPVVWLARGTLRACPWLRRLEWLLEVDLLTRRHPVPLALALLYVVWRGLHATQMGHIGEETVIYPFLAAVSGFNPFLGLVCGALFGAADLLQKLVWPDIFGAKGWSDLNYWSAMGGYVVAYSSTMCMGVLPGLLARVFRQWVRMVLRAIFARRAAAAADGAGPPDDRYKFLKYYDPTTRTFNLNFKDPEVLEVVKGLADDPRNLLADPDGWRQHPDLAPDQKLVLAQLRGRRMLGPESREQLEELIAASKALPEPVPESGEPEPPGDAEGDAAGAGSYAGAELIALLAGGALGAYVTMDVIAPYTEMPAFLWRPDPDVSCHGLEVSKFLRGRAHFGARGGALGGLALALAPPPGGEPDGGRPGGEAPPAEEPGYDVEQATNLQNEINERRAWVGKLRRDHEAFRETHTWESDYQDRLQRIEQEIRDEERTIADLERRLGALGAAPDASEVKQFEHHQRYWDTDSANLQHAQDEARRAAAVHYNNLRKMLERVEREDTLDLRRLLRDRASFEARLGELLTEFGKGPEWLSAEHAVGREAFLRRLREEVEDLGRVDEQGRFFGSIPGDGSPLGDVAASLRQAGRLVGSQRGEVPVVYGSDDAWIDGRASVVNAMSRNLGAEIDQALEEGGGARRIGGAVVHGLLNAVTFGTLSAAERGVEQGWQAFYSRGQHDDSVWNSIKAFGWAVGGGIAHVADHTVIPFSLVRTIGDPDATPGQRVSAAVSLVLLEDGLRMKMGGTPIRQIAAQKLDQWRRDAREAARLARDARLPRIGPEDQLSSAPTDPLARGTYVRNLLRDERYRPDIVGKVGYRGTPLAKPGQRLDPKKVLLGEAFSGKEPHARVYGEAFKGGRVSVKETAIHEVRHVLELRQAQIQAAPGGPLEHYFRGPSGPPTSAGNRRMELNERFTDHDRNIRLRDAEFRRAGIDPNKTAWEDWPAKARAHDLEVKGADRAITRLLNEEAKVRQAARTIAQQDLTEPQVQQRVADLRNEIATLKQAPGGAGSGRLGDARAEMEAVEDYAARRYGTRYNESTGTIEKFAEWVKRETYEANSKKYPHHDGFTCECCNFVNNDKKFFDVDHVQAEAGGGPDAPENARVLCRGCNRSKQQFEAPKPDAGYAVRRPSDNQAPAVEWPDRTVWDFTDPEFKFKITDRGRAVHDVPRRD